MCAEATISGQRLQNVSHFNHKTCLFHDVWSGGLGYYVRLIAYSANLILSCGIAHARELCDNRVSMNKYILLPVLAGSLILAGCGKKQETTGSADSAPAVAAAPAVASFELTANDTMKFNLTRLEVKAGQEVKVTMTNMGSLPKAAMGHNWILLKKGADLKAFTDAAVMAAATDYVPAQFADQIIAHTKLLGPKQSEEVSFKAPTEPGEYHFLCSFPAHFLSGMTGVLVVQ